MVSYTYMQPKCLGCCELSVLCDGLGSWSPRRLESDSLYRDTRTKSRSSNSLI